MKVLFLSHQADFLYGGEICTLAFMSELKKQGVELHFASPPGEYQDRASEFAKVHTIPSIQFSRKVHLLPRLLPAMVKTHGALREIVKREQIDIVHATSLKAMVYAWRLRKHLSIVWHHHDILATHFRNDVWVRTLAKSANLILSPSEATAAALREAGVSDEKIYVLHNGFNVSEWKPRPGKPGEKMKIAMIGEISKRKGSDRLPGILAELSKSSEAGDYEFLIVGEALSDPELAKNLKAELATEIKEGRISFLGRKENIKEFLQGVDVLLVPSEQDPLPTVIVEAGLSGVPVIASPVGGIPEMIVPGKNGFLAKSDGEFAEEILRLKNPQTWAAFSQAAREMAVDQFNIETLTEELLEQYRYIAK